MQESVPSLGSAIALSMLNITLFVNMSRSKITHLSLEDRSRQLEAMGTCSVGGFSKLNLGINVARYICRQFTATPHSVSYANKNKIVF